jgi:hypothetical protein
MSRKIPENFKEWGCSFSGCDGGNLSADTWLCGIEWGGGSYEDGKYYKTDLSKEIEGGEFKPELAKFDWEESLTYTYGRSFAKLYAAIHDEDVANYRKLALDRWNGSELFKLNLYPIAFDSTDATLWHKYKLDNLTGFDEKHLFQTWCLFNRFPWFSDQREKYKPKRIICTGISYLRDFFLCFGGKASVDMIQYGDIEPISTSNTKNKRRYYWAKIDGDTTLIVIPFFSGTYGLNSNALLQKMGERIREISPLDLN